MTMIQRKSGPPGAAFVFCLLPISVGVMPEHIKAGVKHRHRPFVGFDLLGKFGGLAAFFQCDLIPIQRQTIELRTIDRGKAFKLIQRPFFLKHVGQKLHGVVGGKDTGTAARAYFARIGVRC